jgi:hypothetical protein
MVALFMPLPGSICRSFMLYPIILNKPNMAQVKSNSIFSALSGAIGQELIIKQYGDKIVVTKYPDMSRVKPSERQREQRKRMREANQYAQSIMSNPILKESYQKNLQPGESIYKKAVKEYFEKVKGKLNEGA